MQRHSLGMALALALVFGGQGLAQETPSADTATTGAEPVAAPCPPDRGCVTNLPLPRYVSLKGNEGNARRGPGLTHRIDWVFTRAGMPLRVTAEYENWRRVEDFEGAGGWVHFALLSGARTALVTLDMAELHDAPDAAATVTAQAEMGVIARLVECRPGWCRVAMDGTRGWISTGAIWGVMPDETFD